MKFINFLILSVVAIMLACACSNIVPQKRIYTPDITIKQVNGKRYAYYQGKLFSGEVYSSDENAIMTIKNGLASMVKGRVSSEPDAPYNWTIKDDFSILQLREGDYNTPGEKLKLGIMADFINSLPQCDFIDGYR